MIMAWGQDFAEGDSGVVMSPAIAIWNEIEKEKANPKEIKWVKVSANELYGKMIGLAFAIAENKCNHNCDRIAALDLARQAMLDLSSFAPSAEREV